jgi:putative ABC transport system permease protein
MKRFSGFYFLAALILALAIGANTAVCTAAESLILRPLPYRDAHQLVAIHEVLRTGAEADTTLDALADYQRTGVFQSVAVGRPRSFGFQGPNGGAVQVFIAGMVTQDWLPTLGIAPAEGRLFRENEPNVVVLSATSRERLFGAEPALGRTVAINSQPATVIGVMPPNARDIWNDLRIDAWIPLSHADFGGRRDPRTLSAIARLPQDAAPAQAALNVLAQQWSQAYPTHRDGGLLLRDLRQELQGPYQRPIELLAAGALLLTLIAFANLAHLLLVQFERRRRDLAIRLSLGARFADLARAFFAESALIAAAGTAGGVAIAVGLLRLVPFGVAPSGVTYAFAAVAGLLTALLLPLLPLWQARRLVLEREMREGGPAVAGGRRSHRVRAAIVAAEVAVSVVLLTGCLLLARSLQEVLAVKPGFVVEQVYRFGLGIPEGRYNTEAKMAAFYPRLETELKAVPGVASAGVGMRLPLFGNSTNPRFNFPGDEPQTARRNIASNGYFETLGIGLRDGRLFRPAEGENVAVVNETFVRQFGRGLGQRFQFQWNTPQQATIVGVVADVPQVSLDVAPLPEIYLNIAQFPIEGMQVVARTRDGANGLAEALRRADPDLESIRPEPMSAWISRSVGERRLTLSISAGLALLAIALAGVGLYGVIASLAAARHREMALRSALGASPGDILRLVLAQSLRLTAPGLLLGLGAAVWFADVLRSQLFGVGATDPQALAGVVAGIGLLALAAGLLPALRARRADPAQTLR